MYKHYTLYTVHNTHISSCLLLFYLLLFLFYQYVSSSHCSVRFCLFSFFKFQKIKSENPNDRLHVKKFEWRSLSDLLVSDHRLNAWSFWYWRNFIHKQNLWITKYDENKTHVDLKFIDFIEKCSCIRNCFDKTFHSNNYFSFYAQLKNYRWYFKQKLTLYWFEWFSTLFHIKRYQ